MTEKQKEDLRLIVKISILQQVQMHLLDEISGDNAFRHKKKKEWNNGIELVKNFLKQQEIDLYDITGSIKDPSTTSQFLDMTDYIEKHINEINIEL